ncbi:MAG: macro domain-containing protein [Lachnospiraceae bacterium]|nr:macro domain-containing protein [Lachnospiraceae bacterium]
MSKLTVKRSDITQMKTDAIVCPANIGLFEGAGICGDIFREAGADRMTDACDIIGRCEVGASVISEGFKLKCRYVIHTVGPQWVDGQHGENELMYKAYRSALDMAMQYDVHSISIPLLAVELYDYPKEESWRQGLQAAIDFQKETDYELDIQFVVPSESTRKLGREILDELTK